MCHGLHHAERKRYRVLSIHIMGRTAVCGFHSCISARFVFQETNMRKQLTDVLWLDWLIFFRLCVRWEQTEWRLCGLPELTDSVRARLNHQAAFALWPESIQIKAKAKGQHNNQWLAFAWGLRRKEEIMRRRRHCPSALSLRQAPVRSHGCKLPWFNYEMQKMDRWILQLKRGCPSLKNLKINQEDSVWE